MGSLPSGLSRVFTAMAAERAKKRRKLVLTPVAVIPFREILKNKIASGCPTNDSLSFLDILYPKNFDRLGGNWTFSTATPDL
jgi:hypothetical protein